VYKDFREILPVKKFIAHMPRFIFFDYISAKYRGDFIGFMTSFEGFKMKLVGHQKVFYTPREELDWVLQKVPLTKVNNTIFFKG